MLVPVGLLEVLGGLLEVLAGLLEVVEGCRRVDGNNNRSLLFHVVY